MGTQLDVLAARSAQGGQSAGGEAPSSRTRVSAVGASPRRPGRGAARPGPPQGVPPRPAEGAARQGPEVAPPSRPARPSRSRRPRRWRRWAVEERPPGPTPRRPWTRPAPWPDSREPARSRSSPTPTPATCGPPMRSSTPRGPATSPATRTDRARTTPGPWPSTRPRGPSPTPSRGWPHANREGAGRTRRSASWPASPRISPIHPPASAHASTHRRCKEPRHDPLEDRRPSHRSPAVAFSQANALDQARGAGAVQQAGVDRTTKVIDAGAGRTDADGRPAGPSNLNQAAGSARGRGGGTAPPPGARASRRGPSPRTT